MACDRKPCPDHTVCPPDAIIRVVKEVPPMMMLSEVFIIEKLDEALDAMRKDGQGLSLDQERTIKRALGLL